MTDRPFTRPVHTKEMLGYEVGVGFINLVTMGIYIYVCVCVCVCVCVLRSSTNTKF